MTRNQRRALEFGVLGIVAALLWVPLAATSRTQRCQSNLKKLGYAMNIYVRDYDEKYVLANDWQTKLAPYGRMEVASFDPTGESVFQCPQSRNSYALNRWIVGRSLENFSNPAKVPMVFDSLSTQNQPCDGGKSWPASGVHFDPKSFSRQSSMLWMDGHVTTIPAQPKPRFQIP